MNPILAFVWLSENTMGYLNTMPNCDGIEGSLIMGRTIKGALTVSNIPLKMAFFITDHLYLFSSQLTNVVLNTGTS